MSHVTWRWGVNQEGELAHAGLLGEPQTLCGADAEKRTIFHGPWLEMRCPTCEQLRDGRAEIFRDPDADRIIWLEQNREEGED